MLSQSPLPKKPPLSWYFFITDYCCPICKFTWSIQFNRAIQYYALVCGFYPSSCSCAWRPKSHTAWLLYHSGVTHTHTHSYFCGHGHLVTTEWIRWPTYLVRATELGSRAEPGPVPWLPSAWDGAARCQWQRQPLHVCPDISALCMQISLSFSSAGAPASGPQSMGSQRVEHNWSDFAQGRQGGCPALLPSSTRGRWGSHQVRLLLLLLSRFSRVRLCATP